MCGIGSCALPSRSQPFRPPPVLTPSDNSVRLPVYYVFALDSTALASKWYATEARHPRPDDAVTPARGFPARMAAHEFWGPSGAFGDGFGESLLAPVPVCLGGMRRSRARVGAATWPPFNTFRVLQVQRCRVQPIDSQPTSLNTRGFSRPTFVPSTPGSRGPSFGSSPGSSRPPTLNMVHASS